MGPWWQDQCCCFWGEQWNQNLNKNSEEKITVDKFQYRFIFQVDAKVWLRGIGLYGAKDGSKFTVNIKVKYLFQNNYLSDIDWWYKRLNNNLLHIAVIFEQQMLAWGSINPITLQHYRCSWTTTAYSRRPGSTRPTTVPPLSSSSFPNLSRSNPTRGVKHWSNKNKSGIHFTALLWRRTDLQIRHNDRANRRAHLIRPERTKGANQWSCNFLTDLKMVNFDFLWLWCFSRKVVSSTGASGSTFDVTFFTSPLGGKPDLFSQLLTTFDDIKKNLIPHGLLDSDQNGGGTEMGQLPALYFRFSFPSFVTFIPEVRLKGGIDETKDNLNIVGKHFSIDLH